MMGIPHSFSLQDRVALVTGGSGLYGKQIVRALCGSGATVFVTSRNDGKLEQIERDFAEEGCRVKALQLDQADEQSILSVRDKIIQKSGHIDILVNNAVARTMTGWNAPAESFSRSMEVNATGLFLITRAIGDEMAKRGSGSIINVGSIQGMVGVDGTLYEGLGWNSFVPDYFFHKGGMVNLTRFVASYYGKQQVRCNCISPGGLQTEDMDELFVSRYKDRTMLGRMGNETDLMGVIVFLGSDASIYVTGANIPVDGGYTAK